MPELLFEKRDNIAFLTMNRPEVRNAVNRALASQMAEAWNQIRDDEDIRVAIITGGGDLSFSAGIDLKEARGGSGRAQPYSTPTPSSEVGKPIIAAINGYALGGGCEIAMACDIRIASERATLGLPEVSIGGMPNWGGTQRMPRIVPLGFAMELLLTGDRISAQEAYRLGLVNKVVPHDQLMAAAEALAQKICKYNPTYVRNIKLAAYRGLTMHLSEGLELEHLFSAISRATSGAPPPQVPGSQERRGGGG